MSKSILFFVIPFCSIFILTGGGIMISAWRKIALGVQARQWPQTTGRLLSVQSKDSSDSESNSREILVRYAYAVDGKEYEGTTVHPSYGSSSFERAHRGLEALLKPARQVSVYYDAARPERSTLSVGFYSSTLALVSGGFLFFSAGVGFLLAFWFALAGNQDFASGITVIE